MTLAGIGIDLLGSRTLAHGAGWAGVYLLVLAFCERVATRADTGNTPLRIMLATTAMVAVLIVAERFGVISQALASLVALLVVTGGVVGLTVWLLMASIKAHKAFSGRHEQMASANLPAYAALTLALSSSLLWEAVIQPFVSVYGAAPRGYIQTEQVVADLTGILSAAALAWWAGTRFKRQQVLPPSRAYPY